VLEPFPGKCSRGDRPPEKRKVDSSILSLTTSLSSRRQRLTCVNAVRRRLLLSDWLQLMTADDGWLRPIRAQVSRRRPRRCPSSAFLWSLPVALAVVNHPGCSTTGHNTTSLDRIALVVSANDAELRHQAPGRPCGGQSLHVLLAPNLQMLTPL